MAPALRRGDENRPKPRILASTRLNGRMFKIVPFNVPPGRRNVGGDFHRPYEAQDVLRCSVQRAARKTQRGGRFSSPLRNSGCFTLQRSACHSETAALRAIFVARSSGCFTFQRSTCRSESATLRAIFIAPTKLRMFYISAFNVPLGKRSVAGDFHRPYEKPLSEGEREEEILVYPPCHNHGGYRCPGESRANDKEEIL